MQNVSFTTEKVEITYASRFAFFSNFLDAASIGS